MEYKNAITINNGQIASSSVSMKKGDTVFFTIDSNQNTDQCIDNKFCVTVIFGSQPKDAYCIKTISNEPCKTK